MRGHRQVAGVVVVLAMSVPAHAQAQSSIGGGAGRVAFAVWEGEDRYAEALAFEGHDADSGFGVTGPGSGAVTYEAACDAEADVLVEQVAFATQGISSQIDPLLGGARLTGTPEADRFELRTPGCDEPDFDATQEREVGSVLLPVDVRLTTGEPVQPARTFSVSGNDACAAGFGAASARRAGIGAGTIGTDLGQTDLAQTAAYGLAYAEGCAPAPERAAALARARAATVRRPPTGLGGPQAGPREARHAADVRPWPAAAAGGDADHPA